MGTKTRVWKKKVVFDYISSGLYKYKEQILTCCSPVALWGIKKFKNKVDLEQVTDGLVFSFCPRVV